MSTFETDPGYEECIVTFIDILGFRDLLDRRALLTYDKSSASSVENRIPMIQDCHRTQAHKES